MKAILRAGIGAALLLSGCMVAPEYPPQPQPGAFADYRAYANSRPNHPAWKDVPPDLQERGRACRVDAEISYLTADELKKLDAYARGEKGMTPAEVATLQRDIDRRVGSVDEAEQRLEQICPDTLRELKAWREAHPL